jgi:transposase
LDTICGPASKEVIMSRSNLYPVHLDHEQRQRLDEIRRNGYAPAKKILHATVLLLADKDDPAGRHGDVQISETLGVHVNTVARIRKRFVQEGEQPALERKIPASPPVPPKVDGVLEAQLIAICCSAPPQGRVRWTLDLLVEEVTGRKYVTSICRETIRRALKKTNCNPGERNAGASRKKTVPDSSPRWKTSSMSTRPRATMPSTS